jgi:hypothetical protein
MVCFQTTQEQVTRIGWMVLIELSCHDDDMSNSSVSISNNYVASQETNQTLKVKTRLKDVATVGMVATESRPLLEVLIRHFFLQYFKKNVQVCCLEWINLMSHHQCQWSSIQNCKISWLSSGLPFINITIWIFVSREWSFMARQFPCPGQLMMQYVE